MSEQINGATDILGGSIIRHDMNTTTPNQAVITKLIAGNGISITSTGVDPGTGDVTISIGTITGGGGSGSGGGGGISVPVGTVTSVNMTVPTGLTVVGNPVTTAGTLMLGIAPGYVIPLQSQIDTDTLNSVTTRGSVTSNIIRIGGIYATSDQTTVFGSELNFFYSNRLGSSGSQGFKIKGYGADLSFWRYNDGTGDVEFGNTTNYGLKFYANNSAAITVYSNGDTTIGTLAYGGYKLDVNGTVRAGSNGFYGSNGTYTGQLIKFSSGNEVYIDGNGYGTQVGAYLKVGGYVYATGRFTTDSYVISRGGSQTPGTTFVSYGIGRPDTTLQVTPLAGFGGVYEGTYWFQGLGLSFFVSSGTDISGGNNVTEKMRLKATGDLLVTTLAGTGTRMVVADANGILSTQAIPTGGGGVSDNIYTADGTLTGNRILSYTVTSGGGTENKLTFRNTGVTGGPNDDFIFQASFNNPPILQIWNPSYGGQLKFGIGGNIGFGGGKLYFTTAAHDISFRPSGVESGRFFATGNFLIQTGGTFTDAGYKLDVQGTGRFTDTINGRTTDGTGISLFGGSLTMTQSGGTRWLNFANGSLNYGGGVGYGFNIVSFGNINAISLSSDGYTTTFVSPNGLSLIYNNNDTHTIKRGLSVGHIPLYLDITTADYNLSAYGAIPSPHIRLYSGDNTGTGGGGYGNIILQHNGSVKRGNVLIGTSTNIASAILNIQSTTQGFLPPRMTTTQKNAISTPAVGLLVYQTDGTEGTYEYASTGWRLINTGAGSSVNLYNTDGTLTSDRFVTGGNYSLNFSSTSAQGVINVTQNAAGNGAIIVVRGNYTNATGFIYFQDQKTGAGSRGFSLGIGRSGDPSANGDFSFGRYDGAGGFVWSQSGRIFNSTGNWIIGSGSSDAGYLLDVQGTGRFKTGLRVENSSTSGFDVYDQYNVRVFNAGTDGSSIFVGGSTLGGARYIKMVVNGGATTAWGGLRFYTDNAGTSEVGGMYIDSSKFILQINSTDISTQAALMATSKTLYLGYLTYNTLPASAALAIQSTTQGFLMPFMTGAQVEAIGSPASGLLAYATAAGSGVVTSSGWWGYNGSAWSKINSNIYTSDGTLTGNRTVSTTSGYTLTFNPITTFAGSISTVAGYAVGHKFTPTMVATANNDQMVGVDIDPVYTLGSYTPTYRYGLRTRGLWINHSNFNTSNQNTPAIYVGDNTANVFQLTPGTATGSGTTELFMRGNNPGLGNWWLKISADFDVTYDTGPYVGNTYFKMGGFNIMTIKSTKNVLIGTTTDDSTSILTLESTSKGFLPTRMTAAQRTAIATPTTGLITYQTDSTEGLWIKLSSAWGRLLTSVDYTNIYIGDGTLTSARTLTLGGYSLTYTGSTNSSRFHASGRVTFGGTTEDTGYQVDVQGAFKSSGTAAINWDGLDGLILSKFSIYRNYFGNTFGKIDFNGGINLPWNLSVGLVMSGWNGGGDSLNIIRDADASRSIVYIGNSTATGVNRSASLIVDSTSRGVIFPRMTQAQRQAIGGVPTSLTLISGGSGYTNGTYTNVSPTGGGGQSMKLNVVVSGGAVTSLVFTIYGDGYLAGDVLTIPASSIGGTGSGLSFSVAAVSMPSGILAYQTNGAEGYWINTSVGWYRLLTSADQSITNIYNSDGTLTANRTVTMGGNVLTFTGAIPNITTGLVNISSTTSGWFPFLYFSTTATDPAYIRSSNNYFNVIRTNANNDVSYQSSINQSWSDENGGLKAMLYRSTGNWLIQTGGSFSDQGYKLDVQGVGRFATTVGNALTLSIGGSYSYIVGIRQGANTFNIISESSYDTTFATWNGSTGADRLMTLNRKSVQIYDNNSGVTPNTTVLLHLDSTTRGFLLPRMTAAQRAAITTPATGLMVYQTDGTEGSYEYTLASGWRLLNSAATSVPTLYANDGTLGGNRAVTLGGSTLSFVGGTYTTKFFADGTLVIGGTATGGYLFDVQGTVRSTSTVTASDFYATSGSGYNIQGLGQFGRLGFPTSAVYLTASFGTRPYLYVHDAGSVTITTATSFTALTSSLLTLDSTTRGFLPPRMTLSQRSAISGPTVGLIIYQTDNTEGTYEYTSTGWRLINNAAAGTTNIYNTDGTLLANRTITLGGQYLDFVGSQATIDFGSTGHIGVGSASSSSYRVLLTNNVADINGTGTLYLSETFTPTANKTNVNSNNIVSNLTYDLTSGAYLGSQTYNAASFFAQIAVKGNNGTQSTQPIRSGLFTFVGVTSAINIADFRFMDIKTPDNAGVTGHVVNTIYGFKIGSMKGASGFTITNGWGVYQEGTQDNNYFAGKVLIGTNTVGTYALDVAGTGRFTGVLTTTGLTGTYANFSGNAAFGSSQIGIGGSGGWGGGSYTWLEIISNNLTLNAQNNSIASIEFIAASAPILTYTGSANAISQRNATQGYTAGLTSYHNQYKAVLNGTGNAFANTMYVRGFFVDNGTVAANSSTIIPIAFENVGGTNLFNSSGGSTLFGSTYTNLQASAKVQVDATDKGFLPPRMTSAQRTAISSPAVGLIVYQTDGTSGTYEYTAGGWRQLYNSSGTGGGGATGLNVVTVTNNYTVQTTDGVVLVNGTAGSTLTITVPLANNGNPSGYNIKNIGAGIVNIVPTSTELIDGQTSQTISASLSSLQIIPYNNNWYII